MFLVNFSLNYVVAKRVRMEKSPIEQKEFFIEEMYISQSNLTLGEVIEKMSNRDAWNDFITSSGKTNVFIDPRSGRPTAVITVIPFIPGGGNGNRLTLKDISNKLGYTVKEINEEIVRQLVKDFIRENLRKMKIDLDEIREIRVSQLTEFLWQVYISRQYRGVPVRDSNIVMSINNGNLVLWGMEKWGDIDIDASARIEEQEAINIGMNYIGGMHKGDVFTITPHLEIIPISSTEGGLINEGYKHRLVWAFAFQRDGFVNNWEILVDAHSGELISMRDLNLYVLRKIVGSTYAKTNDDCCPQGCPVVGAAMSYVNTGFASPNNYTSLSGQYNYSSGTATTTLNGVYVRVSDNCGSISESSSTGDIDLGGGFGQHDCAVPSGHSAGDTFSSRTCAAEVAQINRIARSWVSYAWLDNTQVTCNVNINQTCNAYYSNSSINMYRSGGGCRNTGEEVASIDHEWGHGLDDNDVNGNFTNPEEVYADLMSIIKLHAYCPDPGWWWTANQGCGSWVCSTNPSSTAYYCDGYGDCCLTCTGLRSLDWADHASGQPHTPANFNCVYCSNGTGPCGRETHCENAPGAEAGWDLAARDLQASPFNYDRQTAFMITMKLYLQGSGNVTTWHSCNCTNGTSDGCAASSGYMQWITADDDDGNLSNGTPHMTAIYAAFNRHAIACSTPTPQNSGCSGGPTDAPILTVTPTSNGAYLSWTAVAGASNYYVFKGTGTWACDMERVKIATVSETSYTDTTLDCHPTCYAVLPVGSNANCYGKLSDAVEVVPPYSAPATVDAAATGPGQVTVSWSSVPGASAYNVYRKYTVCGSVIEELIASNITTTSYIDNDAKAGTVNYYSVSTVSICESSKSGWVSVEPTGACFLTPCFNGAAYASNDQQSNCSITLSWDEATSSCSGYPVIKYNIYRSTDPDFVPNTSNMIAKCITATSYQDTTVQYNTRYYYVVRAEDSRTDGTGPCNGGNEDPNIVKVNAIATGPSVELFSDSFETDLSNWTVSASWQRSTTYAHTGSYSVWSNNLNNRNCDTITKATAVLIPSDAILPRLHFWTRYNIENGYDGGIVQGSSNGTTWLKLTVIPDYPGSTNSSAKNCLGANPQPAFTGSNSTWTEYQVDLSSFAGGNFQVRFNYATDNSVANGGWYIDDVIIDRTTTCTTLSAPGKVINNLTVNKSDSNILLTWQAPGGTCTVSSYGIYRGTLPFAGYDHAYLTCDNGPTSYADNNATSSYYYLVVPNNLNREGAYGFKSNGEDIPAAQNPCRQQDLTVCN